LNGCFVTLRKRNFYKWYILFILLNNRSLYEPVHPSKSGARRRARSRCEHRERPVHTDAGRSRRQKAGSEGRYNTRRQARREGCRQVRGESRTEGRQAGGQGRA
jgi:hypothetical protein